MELDVTSAANALGAAWFNLLRRGSDGSLVLSADRWRLDRVDAAAFRFSPDSAEAAPLDLPLAEVERVSWDQVPRQRARSQIRFLLRSGELWTFSGSVDVAALAGPPQ